MRLGVQFVAQLCRLPKQEFKIQTTIETTFVTMYLCQGEACCTPLSLLSFLIICLAMQISYKW